MILKRGWLKLKELLKKSSLIVGLFLIDLISKTYFYNSGDAIINRGGAFGVFQGYSSVLLGISLMLIFALLYYFKQNRECWLGLSFIIAGALGNVVDRILYGGVIDFIDLGFWPTFNLADVFVVLGVGLVVWRMYFSRK
jgi:lipoprotein signal peptidase